MIRRKNHDIHIDEDVFGLRSIKDFNQKMNEFTSKNQSMQVSAHLNDLDRIRNSSSRHEESRDHFPQQKSSKLFIKRRFSHRSLISNLTTNAETPNPGMSQMKQESEVQHQQQYEDQDDKPFTSILAQQIQMLSTHCLDESESQKRECMKIAQEIGVPIYKLTKLETRQQRENYIIEQIHQQVKDQLLSFQNRNQQRQIQMKKNDKNLSLDGEKEIFHWFDVQSKFVSLKQKLKFALVESLNETANQEKLIQYFEKKRNNKSLQIKAVIEEYPKPDTRQIIDELTNLLKIVYSKKQQHHPFEKNEIEKEKEMLLQEKLQNLVSWDSKLETNFQDKRKSAKERLSKVVKSSSWNQVGVAEMVKQINVEANDLLQRDHLLNKYQNGQFLTTQESKYLANTSELLSQCCDQQFLQRSVNNLDPQIINEIELYIAENILKNYYSILNKVQGSRIKWLQQHIEKTKIKINIKSQSFENQNKDFGGDQLLRIKSKLVAMLKQIRRDKIKQVKQKSEQLEALNTEYLNGNQYANPWVWKFKEKMMEIVRRNRKVNQDKQAVHEFVERKFKESKSEKILFRTGQKEITVNQVKRHFHPSSKLMLSQHDPAFRNEKKKKKKSKEQQQVDNQKEVTSFKLQLNKGFHQRSFSSFHEFYSGGPYRIRPFASQIGEVSFHRKDEVQENLPYKGTWISKQVEIQAANKIKSAIKCYIQRKKYKRYLEEKAMNKKRAQEMKVQKYLESKVLFEYLSKQKTIIPVDQPTNQIGSHISPVFKRIQSQNTLKEKTTKLESEKLDKYQFYQQLSQLGNNQPLQYRRIDLNKQTKNKDFKDLPIKSRKLLFAAKQKNLQWALTSGFVFSPWDINIHDQDGNTPLFLSASLGDEAFVKFLIQIGAKVNMKCRDGNTALHGAFKSNNMLIINMLLQNGAEITLENNNGETPLHYGKDNTLKELNLMGQIATRFVKDSRSGSQYSEIHKPITSDPEQFWREDMEFKYRPLENLDQINRESQIMISYQIPEDIFSQQQKIK